MWHKNEQPKEIKYNGDIIQKFYSHSSKLSFFPKGKQRCRRQYVADSKDYSSCTKKFTTYKEEGLTGGIMALWCSHSFCLGFSVIHGHEGRNDVFSAVTE
jgi:hypothetical protein